MLSRNEGWENPSLRVLNSKYQVFRLSPIVQKTKEKEIIITSLAP